MVLAFFAAFLMTSVGDAWKYLFNLTAGVGLVMILRWYWWRVNAWSEISALAASAIVSNVILWLTSSGTVLRLGPLAIHGFAADDPNAQAKTLLVTVPIATAVWIVTTFITAPEPDERLVAFYRRVRPSGAGWRQDRSRRGDRCDGRAARPRRARLARRLRTRLRRAVRDRQSDLARYAQRLDLPHRCAVLLLVDPAQRQAHRGGADGRTGCNRCSRRRYRTVTRGATPP